MPLIITLLTITSQHYPARKSSRSRTITIGDLLYEAGSPGLAFKLRESTLYTAIEVVARGEERLRLSDAGGIVQLEFTDEPSAIAADLLDRYYAKA